MLIQFLSMLFLLQAINIFKKMRYILHFLLKAEWNNEFILSMAIMDSVQL